MHRRPAADRARVARRRALARPACPTAEPSGLQHEHTLAGLQHRQIILEPGESIDTGFFGIVVADHPAATSDGDARHALRALADPAAAAPDEPAEEAGQVVAPSLFHRALMVEADELTREDFVELAGPDARVECDGHGEPWAASTDTGHLVTAAKQRAVLRPHGQLMRSGSSLSPDEDAVTVTAWMAGSFLSQLTQGHVSRVPVLSLRRSYLGLQQAHGLRLFVAGPDSDEWELLGPPSAWEVGPNHCRWWYRTGGRTIEVHSTTPVDAHLARVELRSSDPVRILAAAHLALLGDDEAEPGAVARRVDRGSDGVDPAVVDVDGGTVSFAWESAPPSAGSMARTEVGGDEVLYPDGTSRNMPWLTFATTATTHWSLTIRPQLTPASSPDRPGKPPEPDFWAGLARSISLQTPRTPAGQETDQLAAVLPSFAHDALIHYLSPRGLEQYTGGGWGTRDVCQGPVGLLLALGRHEELRDLVLRIFRAQNARGDWPQSFEFYRRFVHWGQGDAHGDVVYWPLLALGDYLSATGDAGVLAEPLPYVGDGAPTAAESVLDHACRALAVIEAARIPGTTLPAYGHGDWNDSLQPADPALAARLCSTWTVTLQSQALGALARGLITAGDTPGAMAGARLASRIAEEGAAAMRELLMADDVLAGYGLFDGAGGVEHLVHPRDTRTGLKYSILPMIHAITADLLDPADTLAHLRLVEQHLTGPDGGRLFDRPVRYSGGPMHIFQRAEASTFFGREIGIMYTHAHLRYAEALARVGHADAFLRALALANPIGATERIPSARPRQSTTYYSSSDAAFADRYAAERGYAGVADGSVELEGGWRVYSSGPGLYLRLVVENLCGIRQRADRVEIDPVLPLGLDGLCATVPLSSGRPLRLRYSVGSQGHGPVAVRAGDTELGMEALTNPYRMAGVSVAAAELEAIAGAGREVEVVLS